MARQPRCAAAGLLHLLDLRWCADVSALFGEPELDLLRALLATALPRHQVALHAYALGRSRALLLLTPQTAQGPARLVQDLGRRLAAEMRKRHGRAGPLLAGRFRSAILQAGPHLLDAMQYVEQLPAREGESAASWRWASTAMHCGGARDERVTDHPEYWRTGNTPFEREARHRARLAEPLGAGVVQRLEAALAGGWPLGDEAFLQGLAQQLHRPLARRAPGRPRKPLKVQCI
ncbi:transposase [Piscinibacter sp.]|uniref:transposase n=1 Tax=Piscinibacter sp. TaxID=1903157 RepID=UPI0039E60681